jgi:hypothetical protein
MVPPRLLLLLPQARTTSCSLLTSVLCFPAAACSPAPRWLLRRAAATAAVAYLWLQAIIRGVIEDTTACAIAAACSPLPIWLLRRAAPLLWWTGGTKQSMSAGICPGRLPLLLLAESDCGPS